MEDTQYIPQEENLSCNLRMERKRTELASHFIKHQEGEEETAMADVLNES